MDPDLDIFHFMRSAGRDMARDIAWTWTWLGPHELTTHAHDTTFYNICCPHPHIYHIFHVCSLHICSLLVRVRSPINYPREIFPEWLFTLGLFRIFRILDFYCDFPKPSSSTSNHIIFFSCSRASLPTNRWQINLEIRILKHHLAHLQTRTQQEKKSERN